MCWRWCLGVRGSSASHAASSARASEAHRGLGSTKQSADRNRLRPGRRPHSQLPSRATRAAPSRCAASSPPSSRCSRRPAARGGPRALLARLALKAANKDFYAALLSPSPRVDELWHAFILDTLAYKEACGDAAQARRRRLHPPQPARRQRRRRALRWAQPRSSPSTKGRSPADAVAGASRGAAGAAGGAAGSAGREAWRRRRLRARPRRSSAAPPQRRHLRHDAHGQDRHGSRSTCRTRSRTSRPCFRTGRASRPTCSASSSRASSSRTAARSRTTTCSRGLVST